MNTAKKQQHVVTSRSHEEKPSKKADSLEDIQVQKARIESLKKAIGEKIKDPALAKKAALILSEMLSK